MQHHSLSVSLIHPAMPSKALDHLHRLIHSMDRTEKRYFKLYTSRHLPGGRNGTNILFDAIAAMDTYDEEQLLKRFRNEPFTRRFAIAKRRLYETVLRSLDAFHAERTIDDRLRRRLHEVEILHHKALYADAHKHLKGVGKLAAEHERMAFLLEVNEWERRLMERVNYANDDGTGPGALVEQAAQVHAHMQEVERLWSLKSTAFMRLYRHGQRHYAQDAHTLHGLLSDPLLVDARGLGSSRARYLHHHVRAAVAFALGDLPDSARHLEANHTLLITRRAQFPDAEQLLFAVLSNRIYVHTRLGDQRKVNDLLREFEKWPETWKEGGGADLKLRVFATVTSLRLAMQAHIGDFSGSIAQLPQIEEGLRQHGAHLSPIRRESLYLQMAYAHFGAGRFEAALQWSNRQLNEPGVDQHQEQHLLGRLLSLLIQMELGKHDLLPYTLRNLARFLKAHSGPHRVEQALLDLGRDWSKAMQAPQASSMLMRLQAVLIQEQDEPRTRALLEQLDILSWATAKLTGRSFAEVVRNRITEARNVA